MVCLGLARFVVHQVPSVTQVPNLDPSLVHTYRTSGGGGQRFMHPSDRPAGGGEPSSQCFRASRMLVEMPCFVFEFRYSGGKTPLVIVAMFGMFAIASLTWLHQRWISRLHHVEVQRPTSEPTAVILYPSLSAKHRASMSAVFPDPTGLSPDK